MSNLIGESLGPYQIQGKVGKGGMATVYHAYHRELDRVVAVKVMPEEFAQDSEFLKRFDREAKIVARLQHPNILPIYDYGEENGIPYLVMPYITGGNLKDRIKEKQVSFEDLIPFFTQIAQALHYAHQEGILHRDIKPANILIDTHQNALICDFGLTRLAEHASSISGTGLIGTPTYMSPEQGRGMAIDARSDQYSLGVTLYEMISGQVPFYAESPISVIFQHINDPVPSLSDYIPEGMEDLEDVVMKALSKNPEDRYASCQDLLEAFSHAVNSSYDTVHLSRSVAPKPKNLVYEPSENKAVSEKSPFNLRLIIALLAIVIIGLFSAAMLMNRSNSSDVFVASPSETSPENTVVLSGEDSAATLIMERATQTATHWTETPTLTLSPTITVTASATLSPTTDLTATVEGLIAMYATQTATQWTPSPTPNILATAQAGISHNADWEPVIEVFDGVEMVLVPAGCFMMGSEEGEDDETPIQEQCIETPFWIGRTEVTNLQYGTSGNWAGDNRPRETISWFEAKGYCEARGERLPSEIEFEYVSRGPDSLRFPWGDEFVADNVVYDGNSDNQTSEVGSHPDGASWVGALDMSGNIWEWTSSTYQSYPLNPETLAGAPNDTASLRVMRGGSFDYPTFNIRSAYRYTSFPHNDHFNLGVRCVRDI